MESINIFLIESDGTIGSILICKDKNPTAKKLTAEELTEAISNTNF